MPHSADSRQEWRFIFVVTALARGGTLSVMQQFWSRLERRGTVEVIAHGPNRVEVGVPTTSIGIRRLSSPYRFPHVLVYALRIWLACIRAARRDRRPSAFLVQDGLGTGLGAALAARFTGSTLVVMEHGTASAIESDFFWNVRRPPARFHDRLLRPLLRRTLALMFRAVLRLLDVALLPSEEAMSIYRERGVRPERLLRYHVPIDTERFRPVDEAERTALRKELGLPADKVIVLSVSRLTPEKGVDLLIDAVAALPVEQRENVLLVIAGEGSLRANLEQRAVQRGIAARMAGYVSAQELPPLLRCADVFVYAARQGTNVPVAVLEALASGLAVVGTTEPIAHAEILADGRGTPIPPEDRDAMAEAIARYVGDAALRASSGRRGRVYVEEHHALEVLDAELDAFVSELGALVSRRRGR